MESKKKRETCFACRKPIEINEEKYVKVGTYTGDLVIQEDCFHFICYVKWVDEKTRQKAKNMIQFAQKRAIGVMSKLREVAGDFQGSQQLDSMLNVNLDDEIPKFDDELDEIKKEIEKDGRTRKRRKKV